LGRRSVLAAGVRVCDAGMQEQELDRPRYWDALQIKGLVSRKTASPSRPTLHAI
jgi:hypothetical protein